MYDTISGPSMPCHSAARFSWPPIIKKATGSDGRMFFFFLHMTELDKHVPGFTNFLLVLLCDIYLSKTFSLYYNNLYHLPVPLRVLLFLMVYSLIIWPMVLTLSLNMIPCACTMKKYVLAEEKTRNRHFNPT